MRWRNRKGSSTARAKFIAAFFLALATLLAQDPTSYLTSDVSRIGARLACRCGGCRNTVGNCPMLRCDYSNPMRQKLAAMKAQGMSDTAVVNAIVREQGIVALAAPPRTGLGLITWVMPGIALVIGFLIYWTYVKRNRKEPEPLSAADQAMLERFRAQIDRDLDEPSPMKDGGKRK